MKRFRRRGHAPDGRSNFVCLIDQTALARPTVALWAGAYCGCPRVPRSPTASRKRCPQKVPAKGTRKRCPQKVRARRKVLVAVSPRPVPPPRPGAAALLQWTFTFHWHVRFIGHNNNNTNDTPPVDFKLSRGEWAALKTIPDHRCTFAAPISEFFTSSVRETIGDGQCLPPANLYPLIHFIKGRLYVQYGCI